MSRKFLLSLSALTVAACATTGQPKQHKDPTLTETPAPKAGDKDEQAAVPPETKAPATTTSETATPSLGKTVEVPPPPNEAAQLAFVKRQSSPNAAFTEEDRQFVRELPNSPVAGTVAEAALAIGLIKVAANPDAITPSTFQEADTQKTAAPEAPKNQNQSLEQLCKDHGVNLPDALTENPLLNGYGVAKQVHAALALGPNSNEFKTEITAALKRQANLWQEFSAALNAPGEENVPAAATADPEDSSPPNPADLAGGDAVLGEAQALADRGNYQAAIKKATSVPEGSPMRPMAQEKVKEFSNLAVQELRKKAASAFQSAMPVTDAKTRAGYLKQAKGFLEEAIKNYPDATQLPTVRDNLRVISRDLEKLEGEQGATTG